MLKIETPSATNRPKPIVFVLLAAVGLLWYLGLRSINYDPNGITELDYFQKGIYSLFSPNHMLFRVVVLAVYEVFKLFGYQGLPVFPAQFTTAVSGALGLGLFYWWLRRYVHSENVAILATLGFGGSWSYWVFSTDIYYVTPAAAAVLGALIVLSGIVADRESHPSVLKVGGLALLCATAILFWQANIFFLPVAVLGLFVRYRREPRNLITVLIVFGLVLAVAVGGVYLFAGIAVLGRTSAASFTDWLLHYSARLPIWGKWDRTRPINEAHAALSSLIPVWAGLGLSDLLKGQFRPDKLLPQLSLVALILLFIVPAAAFLRKRFRPLLPRLGLLGLFLLIYAIYLPFNTWWDPFEPKWLVIPNIGLWAIVGTLWDTITERSRQAVLLVAIVATIASANLYATIWPRHAQPNADLQSAECIAQNMTANSMFVITDMRWVNYLSFFYHRNTFDLTGNTAYFKGKDVALDLLNKDMSLTRQRGGRVYMVNLDSYPPEHIEWLMMLTGLTKDELNRFERTRAFSCDSIQIDELVKIR